MGGKVFLSSQPTENIMCCTLKDGNYIVQVEFKNNRFENQQFVKE